MRRLESLDPMPMEPSGTTCDPMRTTIGEKKKPTRFIVTDAPEEPDVSFSPRNVEHLAAPAVLGDPEQSLQPMSQQGSQHVRIRQGKMEQKGRFTIIDLLPSSPRTEQFEAAQAHVTYALTGRTDELPAFDNPAMLPNSRRQAKFSSESVTVSCDFSVQYTPQTNISVESQRHSSHQVARTSVSGGSHEKWLSSIDAPPMTQFPSRHAHFRPLDPTQVAEQGGMKQPGPWEVAAQGIPISDGLLDQLMHQASENQRLLEDMVLHNDSILREFEKLRLARPKALADRNATNGADQVAHLEGENPKEPSIERKPLSATSHLPAFHSPKKLTVVGSPRSIHLRKEIHITSQTPSDAEGPWSAIQDAFEGPNKAEATAAANATIRISTSQVNVIAHGPPAADDAQDDPPPDESMRLVAPGSEELEDMMISQALHLMNSFSSKDSKTNHVSISSTTGNGYTQTTVFNQNHPVAGACDPPPPLAIINQWRPLHQPANPSTLGNGAGWSDHHASPNLFPNAATYTFGHHVPGVGQGGASHPHQILHFSQTQSITMQSNQPIMGGQVYSATNEKTFDVFQCLDPLCQPPPRAPGPFGAVHGGAPPTPVTGPFGMLQKPHLSTDDPEFFYGAPSNLVQSTAATPQFL